MEHIKKANLDTTEIQKLAIYNNGDLALFDNLGDIDMEKSIQTEIYIITLVLEGRTSLNFNGTPYLANRNDLFICPPHNLLENAMLSVDFKCHCIGMSARYIQRIIPMAENSWDIKILFEKNPVCSLTPEEVTVFCQYYDLLCSKTHLPSVVQGKVIDTLMQAFMFDMQYILGRVVQVTPHPFTSGEYLFKRFVELLESSWPKSRNVSSYAARLHVTPKYLSSVCKTTGGETASSLIDRYVLKDIEYLMKHSSKSIKEMAGDLDFPNISFFGKYVKKHFGMSPKTLREKYRQEYDYGKGIENTADYRFNGTL